MRNRPGGKGERSREGRGYVVSGIRQKGMETAGGKGNRKDLKRSKTNDYNKGYTRKK